MGYYSDTVSNVLFTAQGQQSRVKAATTAPCVQLYAGGSLLDSCDAIAGSVSFLIGPTGPLDMIFLLGVDSADAGTDYFSDAFPLAATQGNRIELVTIVESGYLPSDKIRVYRGAAGAASATQLVSESPAFPNVSECGGWGTSWGSNWGFGDYGVGWGYCWGYQWGFGAATVAYLSEPLPCGTYPIKITVVDEAGNESVAVSQNMTVTSIPRPASDLTIESYTSSTDTLSLSWTASPDL